MKRLILLCGMFVALCSLAYASVEVVDLGTIETKDGIITTMGTEEIQAEIEALSAQMMAAKEAGFEPDAALYARLAELEALIYEPVSGSVRLDQGGETCETAYEITSLPFCDSGIMGATTDCTPTTRPFLDIFYKFTPTVTGIYRVSTCGSVGDTRMNVWRTTCCGATTDSVGYADDECGGMDLAKDFTLETGLTYYFHIGYYGSTQLADAYNFNLFGPEPTSVPANDLCTGAIPLAAPSTTLGTCRNATDDAGLPSCAASSLYYKGVWYTVVGNGNNLTATTVNNCTSMNTFIRVLTAPSCSGPWTCVGGNNDYGTSSGLSQYTWCSDVGVTYYIIVSSSSSTAGYVGPFTLSILNGSPCACDLIPLCGTPTETEPNGVCPSAVDPFVIDCAETVYALHCPEADVDYFPVAVPPMTVMWLYHYDGTSCTVNPTTGVQSRVYDANCVLLGGPTTVGWRLTNPTADTWNIFIEVYATTSTYRTPYKLVSWCCDVVNYCANPILLTGVYTYTNTANSCCATNPVSCVYQTACGGTCYTSGNDIVYRFTILSTGNLTITASSAGDNQVMVFTDCANPTTTCVASADVTFTGSPEVITATLPAGTYFVSTSLFSTGCGDITLAITSDVPLPVELTTLEAIAGDREVTLRWMTASEWNNARFDVQRKTASSGWTTVGTVEGAGNSQTVKTYEYVDHAVVNDVTYTYRLLSRDVNGVVNEYERTAEATPGAPMPTEYALAQNHPNPFNPNTSISYSVKEAGFVTLKVYNLMGQEVATLVSAQMPAGRYAAEFTAKDLPSGIYVYRLEVNDFTAQKKMILLK
ncbi:MAG: T9SS type A sorting domain-containing protein [bacterium]